jgi:hypothetical protein
MKGERTILAPVSLESAIRGVQEAFSVIVGVVDPVPVAAKEFLLPSDLVKRWKAIF